MDRNREARRAVWWPLPMAYPDGDIELTVFETSPDFFLRAPESLSGRRPCGNPGNEMMDVPVPRKARSVHPKRSHDWISSGSGGSCGVGDQIHRQASTSPVRQGPVSTSTPSPAPPLSPSSSNASGRRKIKANGSKQRPPPKSSSKSTSSNNPEELEIEIAEVLYGLMTQSQAPLKKEIASNDTREVNNRSCADTKSRVSSPVSGSPSPAILPSVPNSSSAAPFSAPRRGRDQGRFRRIRAALAFGSSPSSASAKAEMDQTMKGGGFFFPKFREKHQFKMVVALCCMVWGSSINSQSDPTAEPMKVESEIKPPATEQAPGKWRFGRKGGGGGGELSRRRNHLLLLLLRTRKRWLISVTTKPSTVSEVEEGQREEKKIQIDLMAPPPPLLRSSPERKGSATMDIKTIASESLPILVNITAFGSGQQIHGTPSRSCDNGWELCPTPPLQVGGHGGVAIFPGLAAGGGKDKGSQPPTLPDHPAQRKQQQILLQQALPPPIAPQQFTGMSPAKPANAAASNASRILLQLVLLPPEELRLQLASATRNMPPNETPYLAILQNNAYFPIAAVGPPLNYRATHPSVLANV
nr:protein TIME FOR COFFEE isoform X3 [Ipomoea batatas]